MARWMAVVTLSAIGVLPVASAVAQVKELPGEKVTVSGTVEAIDHANRVVTLRAEDGTLTTVDVPAETQKFDAVKVGDVLTATYYDTVSVRVKAPGEAAVNALDAALTRTGSEKPGATVAAQRTMTATIEAIDPKVPSVTFTGPNGWKYSRKVEDKKMLEKVKVGDRVDFVWTEAVLIDVSAPKK